MLKIIKRMNDNYNKLTDLEGEAMLDTAGRRPCISHHTYLLEPMLALALRSKLDQHKKTVMSLFVTCTKDDVTLNNFIVRVLGRFWVLAEKGKDL